MDKVTLAIRVRQTIAELGRYAADLGNGDITREFYEDYKKAALQEIILFGGALAATVLDEHRKTGKPLMRLAVDNTKAKDKDYDRQH